MVPLRSRWLRGDSGDHPLTNVPRRRWLGDDKGSAVDGRAGRAPPKRPRARKSNDRLAQLFPLPRTSGVVSVHVRLGRTRAQFNRAAQEDAWQLGNKNARLIPWEDGAGNSARITPTPLGNPEFHRARRDHGNRLLLSLDDTASAVERELPTSQVAKTLCSASRGDLHGRAECRSH